VLEDAYERIIVGEQYGDIPLGLYIIRGENVVLLGQIVRCDLALALSLLCRTDIANLSRFTVYSVYSRACISRVYIHACMSSVYIRAFKKCGALIGRLYDPLVGIGCRKRGARCTAVTHIKSLFTKNTTALLYD
jgi:hypothetical protein